MSRWDLEGWLAVAVGGALVVMMLAFSAFLIAVTVAVVVDAVKP